MKKPLIITVMLIGLVQHITGQNYNKHKFVFYFTPELPVHSIINSKLPASTTTAKYNLHLYLLQNDQKRSAWGSLISKAAVYFPYPTNNTFHLHVQPDFNDFKLDAALIFIRKPFEIGLGVENIFNSKCNELQIINETGVAQVNFATVNFSSGPQAFARMKITLY